jgi:hypothetical protein
MIHWRNGLVKPTSSDGDIVLTDWKLKVQRAFSSEQAESREETTGVNVIQYDLDVVVIGTGASGHPELPLI